MAKIISFQQCLVLPVDGCWTFVRQYGVVSIDLENVQNLTCEISGYAEKIIKPKRSFLSRLLNGGYEIVYDESRPGYGLRLEYKNHSQEKDYYLLDKEEYVRLKPELARYGWII